MTTELDTFKSALRDPSAHKERQLFCRIAADSLQACGDVLWAFGLAEQTGRRALAIVLQMAGRLASGAIALLESENWHAACALVRQLIETEYLLFRFASESSEADQWLSGSSAEIRKLFNPGAMRRRSGDQFRVGEYAVHCDRGGHPNPRAAFLLPEHALIDDMLPFGSLNWLWVDLAQYLARLTTIMATAVHENELAHVGIARSSIEQSRTALANWRNTDPCASRELIGAIVRNSDHQPAG